MLRQALPCALLIAACSGPEAPPTPAETPSQSVEAPRELILSVDGQRVPVTLKLADRPSLASLAGSDPSSWSLVRASGHAGGRLNLKSPAENHPDHDVLFFTGSDGSASLGVFRRLDDSVPPGLRETLKKPKIQVHRVNSVGIWTGDNRPPETTVKDRVVLQMVVGDKPAVDVLRSTLNELPRLEARKRAPAGMKLSNRARKKLQVNGCSLADLVALRTPLETVATVVLHTGDGQQSTISGDALRGPEQAALLRINKKGQAVLEHLDLGVVGENRVRNVTQVVVTLL